MLGCYCDCPEITLPFDASTFFNQQDLDMINGVADIPNEREMQSDKILWYGNWSTTQWSAKNILNGGAVITDDTLKREVWEWLHEAIHPGYFQKIWDMHGRKRLQYLFYVSHIQLLGIEKDLYCFQKIYLTI